MVKVWACERGECGDIGAYPVPFILRLLPPETQALLKGAAQPLLIREVADGFITCIYCSSTFK